MEYLSTFKTLGRFVESLNSKEVHAIEVEIVDANTNQIIHQGNAKSLRDDWYDCPTTAFTVIAEQPRHIQIFLPR